MSYKFGISGIRGIYGKSITLLDVAEIGLGFSKWVKSRIHNNIERKIKIGLANDSRKTAFAFKKVLSSVLEAEGIDVFDYGFIPTPSLFYSFQYYSLDAAIMITASHNPIEWNGFKFISSNGQLLKDEDIISLQKIIDNKTWKTELTYSESKIFNTNIILLEAHVNKVLSSFQEFSFDIQKIIDSNFKVFFDVCNGPISNLIKIFCKKLNIDYVLSNDKPDSLGEREIEPNQENLKESSRKIKEYDKIDIGFAFDLDGDRIIVLYNDGEVLSEEYSIFLGLNEFLNFYKVNFVVNTSSSKIFDDLADIYGVKVFRSKTGERYVLDEMIQKDCIIGAEGNGGIIFSKIGLFKDSLVTAFLILHSIARYQKNLKDILVDLKVKNYTFLKEKIYLKAKKSDEDLENIYSHLEKAYKDGKISRLDGIRVEYKTYWFQVRSSNTESILRIFIESENGLEDAQIRIKDIYKKLRKFGL